MLKLYTEDKIYYAKDLIYFESKLLKSLNLEIDEKKFLYEEDIE